MDEHVACCRVAGMEPDDILPLVQQVVILAHNDEIEAALETAGEIHHLTGDRGLYSASCAWAGMFLRYSGFHDHGENKLDDTSFGFHMMDGDSGELLNPEDVPELRGEAHAMRFIIAFANEDHDMTMNLWHAVDSVDFAAAFIGALITFVGMASRRRAEESA